MKKPRKLESAGARITESRMLLMAGLLLADRTAASEEKLSKRNDASISLKHQILKLSEHDSILDAKLKAAELEISNLKSQISNQHISSDKDTDINQINLETVQLEIDEAKATISFMLNKVKSLV